MGQNQPMRSLDSIQLTNQGQGFLKIRSSCDAGEGLIQHRYYFSHCYLSLVWCSRILIKLQGVPQNVTFLLCNLHRKDENRKFKTRSSGNIFIMTVNVGHTVDEKLRVLC